MNTKLSVVLTLITLIGYFLLAALNRTNNIFQFSAFTTFPVVAIWFAVALPIVCIMLIKRQNRGK